MSHRGRYGRPSADNSTTGGDQSDERDAGTRDIVDADVAWFRAPRSTIARRRQDTPSLVVTDQNQTAATLTLHRARSIWRDWATHNATDTRRQHRQAITASTSFRA